MSAPTTARKLIVTSKSSNFRQVTKIVDFNVKKPINNQVLVRVYYAGINASDINYTAGHYIPNMKYPADTGFEAVGKVVDVGPQVRNIQPGDTVLCTSYGAFTEYLLVPSRVVINLGSHEAVDARLLTLPVSGLTASVALDEVGQLKKGETLLVTAAAGGTGLFAVQLGVLTGCHVIGTCSSEEKSAMLKKLGCHRVVNYKKESLDNVLKSEYPKGVDVVYESVGGETFDVCVKHLAIKGRLVIIGMVSGYQDQSAWRGSSGAPSRPISSFLLGKSASVRGFFLNNFLEEQPKHFRKLMQLFQQKRIDFIVDGAKFVGLESIADAIEYMYNGKNVGKVVVQIQAAPNTDSGLTSKL